MGKKVNPIGFRLPLTKAWQSIWYARSKEEYASFLARDIELRSFLSKRLKSAGLAKILIESVGDKISITLHSSRPGIVFGKKGVEIEALKNEILKKFNLQIVLNVVEVRAPELNAALIAADIARQLTDRKHFRRALRRAKQMAKGALGIKIQVAGRLGGVDIARKEKDKSGRVPLHTLRENIDYGFAEAHTTFGVCGVKVWLCLDKAESQLRRNERSVNHVTSTA